MNRQAAQNKVSEIRHGQIKGYRVVGDFEELSPRPTLDGWVAGLGVPE